MSYRKRLVYILTIFSAGCLVALVLWAKLKNNPHTNVLLVSYDTLRPDHLGCYGYIPIDTSNTDWVADNGAIFTQAFTSVPITSPSHSSVMTGLEVYSHGVRENGSYCLRNEFETLAEILSRNGYRTGAVVAGWPLDRRFGLKQGFDFYEDKIQKGEEKKKNGPWYGDGVERTAKEVADIAIKWLKDNKNSTFFLFVHFFDPHGPYEPPEEYIKEYGSSRIRRYDGEIAYVDDQFGRILEALNEEEIFSRTLIVIFSDHGEAFGEHKLPYNQKPYYSHGLFIYEEEIKTALIMMKLGLIPSKIQIEDMVRLSDITPTILDMLQIHDKFHFDGKSLLPTILGDQARGLEQIYCETIHPIRSQGKNSVYGIRTENLKVVSIPKDNKTLVFDLGQDPAEKSTASGDALKKLNIDSFLKEIDIYRVKSEREGLKNRFKLTKRARKKLRALGYIQ